MSQPIIYVNSDNLIRFTGVKAASSGNYINNATVTATIKTLAGEVVEENISLDYVADSDGNYSGVIESTVSLTANTRYQIEVTFDASGINDQRTFIAYAKKRGVGEECEC